MSHSMRLVAPGYVEHWPSVHLYLVRQRQPGYIIDISLHTFISCLPRPSSLFSARNRKVCDSFDTRLGLLYMAIPSGSPSANDRCNIISIKFPSCWRWCCFVSVFDATDPADLATVIAPEPLHFRVVWSPCFATDSRANVGLVHFAEYPRWEVSGGRRDKGFIIFPKPHNIWQQWHCHSPTREQHIT